MIAALALIAGCASMDGVAPNASPREASALATQRTLQDVPVSDRAWPARDWWKALQDPQLDALIDEALRDSPTLAVGAGVQFAMFAAGGGQTTRQPSINHVCLSVERFDQDAIIKALESYGIKPRDNQTGPVGPMRHYVSMRKEDRGGAKDGTPELYFTDPDGILVQVQDVTYCGGAGYLGNVCTVG